MNMNERLDVNLEPFEKGLFFTNKRGDLADLSDISVLNVSIDTVRQFYKGTIDRHLIRSLETLTADGALVLEKELINSSDSIQIRYLDIPFDCKLSKMGKNSGYRFKLQNNKIGVIILLGSYYKQTDQEFTHLKIELSPHFIQQRDVNETQAYMDKIANMFIQEPERAGVAPHLCVDLQGWNLPLHMQDDIVTRSKFIRSYQGIEEFKLKDFDNVISTFGRAETLMVGKATSLQLSVYRKDLEIVKSDKVDYWHEIWDNYSLGFFDKEKPVVRVEYRFHHSIIKEFERGINEDLNSYAHLHQYLDDLWQYALKTIRYESDGYIKSLWQFLMEDIEFTSNDLRTDFKRQQKPKSSTASIRRNLGLFMGNYLSIRVRSGVKFHQIEREIKQMAIMDDINNYLYENNLDQSVYFQTLRQKYLERETASRFASLVA